MMPTFDEITTQGPTILHIPSTDWLRQAFWPGLVRGGIYLMSGEPGGGKTTAGLQVAGDLAISGTKVLYLTTEQSPSDIRRSVERLYADEQGLVPEPIRQNLYIDGTVESVGELPRFLDRSILADEGDYHGVQVIILDSVQGRGLLPTAYREYRALYAFASRLKTNGLVALLTAHVNKRGRIAGPRTLEHNVDCVLHMGRAFRLRFLFVPKNRFGPALMDPLVLTIDGCGRLEPAPHAASFTAVALGYGGTGADLTECQACVSLPRYGSRPSTNAPHLPTRKFKHVLGVLSNLPGLNLTSLSYDIRCYAPQQRPYSPELDLAISAALLASFLRQPVPNRALFVGEVDLLGRVRPPEQTYLDGLALSVGGPQHGYVGTIYVADQSAEHLGRMRPLPGGPPLMELLDIRPVASLASLVCHLWPSVLAESPRTESPAGRAEREVVPLVQNRQQT